MNTRERVMTESLNIPSGKSAQEMPYSHYRNLVKTQGYAKTVRSLGQLAAWNANKNPELAEWARDFQKKLKKEFSKTEQAMYEAGFGDKIKSFFGGKKDASSTGEPTEDDKKLMQKSLVQINNMLRGSGVTIKADEASLNPHDPSFSGNLTYNAQGAKGERLYNACVKSVGEGNIFYSNRSKAVVADCSNGKGSVLIYIYATLEKTKPNDINPEEREGAEVIADVNDMIQRRLIKFDNGKIVPFTDNEKIIMHNKQLWLVPNQEGDESTEFYKFLNQPSIVAVRTVNPR